MRLDVLEHGYKPKQRLALRLMRLAGRTEPDPVAKTSYGTTTALLMGSTVTVERLKDWREGSFDPRLTATMQLLEKVTRGPGVGRRHHRRAVPVLPLQHREPLGKRVRLRLGGRRRPAQARRHAQPDPLPRTAVSTALT
jgi:hypothetical protein